jgi:hypothetical protein
VNARSLLPASAFAAGAVVTGVVIASLGGTRTDAADEPKGGPIYAQLSSVVTQKPSGKEPLIVAMESNDAVGGIGHNDRDKNTDVVVKTAGVYFIMAAAQVGRDKDASDDYLDLWIKQNGKDVDNSNTRQAVKDASFTGVLVCQGIAECKAGDVITVAAAASAADKGLGLVATKPKGEPAIPSIIFSMYKIN